MNQIDIKMAYRLDASKAQTLQISNDAFWYLYQEEEMLDESNMEEAKEVMQMFPFGYLIKEDFMQVEDEADLIECTFIPYVEDVDIKWDGESRCYNSKGVSPYVLLFKIVSHDKCFIRSTDERDGRIFNEGEFNVVYFNGNPWCEIPSKSGRKQSSLIPLCGKFTKYFTSNRF